MNVLNGRLAKGVIAAAMALLLCLPFTYAYAATDNIEPDATLGLQKTVEQTAEEYNQATQRVEEVNRQIQDNESQIAQFDERIAEYRAVCSVNMVDLYKLQRDGSGILSVILDSEDLSTFLTRFNYFNRVQESAMDNLTQLSQLLKEREDTQKSLETAKADAEREQERAERAAALAIYQREEAQKAAEEKAKQEAKEREEAEAAGGQGSGGSATVPSPGDADWSQDKSSFVSSWAGRLDAYLAGSPLSGHGKTFASAAWDAGIDPRYSAAIAEVESSKGASCYRPYNAWGWGGVSWGSWEEAIPAHAFGLAAGYGYTVSEEAAKKYCENWQFWYNRVSQEMAKI